MNLVSLLTKVGQMSFDQHGAQLLQIAVLWAFNYGRGLGQLR